MPMHNIPANAKESKLSAVVTRADGTIEDLGVIAYYSKNPLKHYLVNRWIKIKEARRSK